MYKKMSIQLHAWLLVVFPILVMFFICERIVPLFWQISYFTVMLLAYGIMSGAVVTYFVFTNQNIISSLGTKHSFKKFVKYLLFSFVIICLYSAVYYRVLIYPGSIAWQWKNNYYLSYVLWQLFVVALIEEWYFRGYAYYIFNKASSLQLGFVKFPISYATISSAIAFTFIHIDPGHLPQFLLFFFPGLFFGVLRERTGNIFASVCVHAACNVLVPNSTNPFFIYVAKNIF